MTDITDEETERAIKALKNNKAVGLDAISELLKHGDTSIIGALTSLMNSCWKEKCAPGDWRKGVTIKLPKKGDISHCNNYRKKLFCPFSAVFCLIILNRLRDAVDATLREEQAGFRRGQSRTEQCFTLRNIIE